MQQKQSAVLAADIVGYTRLMHQDEAATLADLKSLRSTVFNPQVKGCHGALIKSMGDGWLVTFDAVPDAISCARTIQRALRGHPRFRLRIGIHFGAVTIEDEDIFGDAVNLAARLQEAAEAGGILLSEQAIREAGPDLAAAFSNQGPQRFKNVDDAITVYRWNPAPAGGSRTGKPLKPPAVAVLPFDNLSSDPEGEILSDGLSEDIITTLSKIPQLRVIARNSTFTYKGQAVDIRKVGKEQSADYVLEGSTRKAGNRLRITAQLIDAQSGHHVWADRYDRDLDDIFELQDEISLRVATELQVELLEGEMARLKGSGTRDLRAWYQQIRAFACTREISKQSFAEAKRYALEAHRLDPGYAAPLCTLGFVKTVEARHLFTDTPAVSAGQARDYAHKALELDPHSADAYAVLGFVHAIEGHHDLAVDEFHTALSLNPNHADVAMRLSITLSFAGRAEEAIHYAQRAIQLSPHYPGFYAGILGMAHRLAGNHMDAIDAFQDYSRRTPGFGHMDLALTYAELGDFGTAAKEAQLALKARPDFTITHWAGTQIYADPAQLDHEKDLLRKAGFPE
ncbi:adenylate/guanylate cyclase domain-containing protein [Leisingera sp. ANG-Vp]|uniref:adenylate/guanylate cyclase domain-containing protein n=1 Tax=Leisingera sp. ANG-Vp TaxID=1577896 RepID=UPI000AD7ECF8|nr:adenylate/guanylate cyclase domain-containing protein [Leisingera sp. ANG-Vp]